MICAKCGSDSTDADYCSNCGAKMGGAPSGLSAVQTSAPIVSAPTVGDGSESCPDCGTSRRSGARFCEVCRYNFDTGASGVGAVSSAPPIPQPDPIPTVESTPPPPSIPQPDLISTAPVADAPSISEQAAPVAWEITAKVDPALYVDPDPNVPCPTDEPERIFPLDFAENLIGRRSDRKDIHPEIPLPDPGISHRHAKLLRLPDGNFVLLDVGSTNGTLLNNVEVKPGVRTPLQDGDEIVIGCWTRITIHKK